MKDFIRKVKEFNFPIGKYTVVGGGALAARGLRKTVDIDFMITEDLYEQLKKEGWEEKEKSPGHFHVYKNNAEAAKNFLHVKGCRLDRDEVIKNSDLIEGIPVMNLNDLVELKRTLGREKDLDDIKLITRHLNQ